MLTCNNAVQKVSSMLWRQPSTIVKMVDGGGGCLLHCAKSAQLLCWNQLHNPSLARAGMVSQQADEHDRHVWTQMGASRAGRSPVRLLLWTGLNQV